MSDEKHEEVNREVVKHDPTDTLYSWIRGLAEVTRGHHDTICAWRDALKEEFETKRALEAAKGELESARALVLLGAGSDGHITARNADGRKLERTDFLASQLEDEESVYHRAWWDVVLCELRYDQMSHKRQESEQWMRHKLEEIRNARVIVQAIASTIDRS